MNQKDGWRFASADSGAPFAMTSGAPKVRWWCAGNLATMISVS